MVKSYALSCPIAKTLELVGERWTLLIVRDLLKGAKRFQDLQNSLDGISANVLSTRLKLLEDHGIATRRMYSERPPRAEYLLTEKGQTLETVVVALGLWGFEHIYGGKKTRKHKACGQPIQCLLYCPTCQESVHFVDTEV